MHGYHKENLHFELGIKTLYSLCWRNLKMDVSFSSQALCAHESVVKTELFENIFQPEKFENIRFTFWMNGKKNFKTELFEIYNVAIVVILLRSSFIQTQMQNGFCFVKFLWHPVDKIFDALWFSNFVTRCKWHLNIQGLCSSIHEESVAVCEKHCFYF